jgi:hypothetical protein
MDHLEIKECYVFSGGAVEEDGENIWKMRRCDQKLECVEQRSRGRETEVLGRSAGNKKLKTAENRLGCHFDFQLSRNCFQAF